MNRVLYLNCESGMSGDMFLSTMVDLGVPHDYLCDRLSLLGLDGYRLSFDTVERQGIPASSVDVVLADRTAERTNPYSGNYRNYRQIREMITEREKQERFAGYVHQTVSDATIALELSEALGRLQAEERELVLLSAVAGLKSREIASIYGMTAGSVRSKVSRSLSKMRKFLEMQP